MVVSSEDGSESGHGRENWIATILLSAAVALAPLPYGATDPSALCLLVAGIGVALLFTRFRFTGRRDFLIAAYLLVVAAGYALVLHEQLSAAPWFAPHIDPVWDQMGRALGEDARERLSVVRDQPFIAIGNSFACMGALVCAFAVCHGRRNADLLLKVVAWSGLAYGLYGIAAYLVRPETVLWREKVLYRGVLSATFINRNTAAVYFGVASVLWALLLLRDLQRRDVLSKGQWRWARLGWDRQLAVNCTGFVVCFLAMMLTGSRAGVAISLLGLVTAGLLLLRRELRSGRVLRWTAIPVLGGLLLGYLVLGGQVSERLSEHGLTGGGRWDTYVSTSKMISEHPVFGTGLGTFVYVFPRYRSGDVSIWGIWDRAHNTLLELAAEMGVPLALIVAAGWALALLSMGNGALHRRRGAVFPIAGLVCAAIAALHSLIDFSLQIPGFAVTAMALIGMGLAQSERGTGPDRSNGPADGANVNNVNAESVGRVRRRWARRSGGGTGSGGNSGRSRLTLDSVGRDRRTIHLPWRGAIRML